VHAVNKHRLRNLYAEGGGTVAEVDRRILASPSARDLALSRRDIGNIRVQVHRGKFRRAEQDAESVKLLV
jgi:hypothetical protein